MSPREPWVNNFIAQDLQRIQRLRYVNEALKAVDSPEKSTESNDGTFLNDGSVIARAFFDNTILLLRRCYDDVTSWKILVLPMVYVI